MKKLLIASILLLSTFITNAHHLVDGCTKDGRRNITIVDGPIGGTAHVELINGTGIFDTTVNIVAFSQDFTVPQPSGSVDVYVTYSDSITNELITGTNKCTVLAFNPVTVSYEVDNGGNTTVYIKITNEQNIKSLRIVDRKTKQVYTIIIPNGSGLYTIKLQ